MPDNHNHSKQYSATDIQRYLNHQMSAEERHVLEKAALEDPFLAEAIEGYLELPSSKYVSDIGELEKRLQERTALKNIPYRKMKIWWSAAAAILIVSGLAITSYWLLPSGNIIAKHEEKQQKIEQLQETPSAAESAIISADSTGNEIPGNSVKEQSSGTNLKTVSKKPSSPLSQETSSSDLAVAESGSNPTGELSDEPATITRGEQSIREVNTPVVEENEKAKKMTSESRDQPAPVIQNNTKDNIHPKIITGKITDPHNRPLPFVNLHIENDPYGIYSDAAGNFKLMSEDTTSLVNVKSIGFQPRQMILYTTIPVNHILLEPDGSENEEISVLNKRSARMQEKAKNNNIDESAEAMPADGWKNYNIYLANNIRLPDPASLHKMGSVDLIFTVDLYGRLSDFKILQSTCPRCNKEAIRLIKDGPRWKLPEGTQSRQVSINIQF